MTASSVPSDEPTETTEPVKAVALDLGQRRIGVAVSNASGTMAFPREHIERKGRPDEVRAAVVKVVTEDEATLVVVGHPLSLNGQRGKAALGAEEEAAALTEVLAPLGVSVVLFDERMTTVSAAQGLAVAGKRGPAARQSIDSAAATVLLQAWLDQR
jgi:putative holliday junction resolvase